MKHLKTCGWIGAVGLFMALVFQPGCRILVNGTPLGGVYSLETAVYCADAAQRAAEEITRDKAEAPFTLIPVLCLRHTETDTTQLTRTLLGSYEGVREVYAVYLNDRKIGVSTTPVAAKILQREFFPEAKSEEILVTKPVFTYTDGGNTLPELRQAMAYLLGESEGY